MQWGLRLLVTYGSRLLELDDIRRAVGPFDRKTLTYPWVHADPQVDRLQADVMAFVGVAARAAPAGLFASVAALAGLQTPPPLVSRSAIPYLNEPWFC